MTESQRMFYQGVICALAVVHARGEETTFEEIVNTVDEDVLISEARRSGNMKWSGLSYYLRQRKANAA